MSNKTKNIIIGIVFLQILFILGLYALPAVAQSIPGRYRVALQERAPAVGNIVEGVINQVAPAPEVLPAAAAQAEQVDIAALLSEPTAAATPVPTNTPLPSPTPPPAEPAAEDGATAVPPTPAPTNTPLPTPTIMPTPEPLPTQHVIAGVDVVRQTFNNCGPANLTQVLNFYGNEITQDEIAAYLKPNSEDRNVSPWQIEDYVNGFTYDQYRATAHSNGTLEMLKRFIAAGYPVVIEKGYVLPDSGWWGHYLTVYGYDDEAELFFSQDSYLGPWDGSGRSDDYTEFEEFWQDFNYTFYVVYRPEQEAEVYSILGPEMTDEIAMWRAAAARAQAEIDADSEDAFAWFNLGTSLTRLGEISLSGNAEFYAGGAQAFDQAREIGLPYRMLWYQFRPYIAYWKVGRYDDVIALADSTLSTQGGRNVEETYRYKGIAQEFLGDINGAIESYQAALAVNENFYPAEWSLNALTGGQ